MKKFIKKLFKGKSQQEPSENLPVSEKVCQKQKEPPKEDLSSVPIPKPEPICQEPVVIPSSPPMENTKAVSEGECEVRALIPVMRSEFNFLRYPFFDLSPRASKKDQIEVREVVEVEWLATED